MAARGAIAEVEAEQAAGKTAATMAEAGGPHNRLLVERALPGSL